MVEAPFAIDIRNDFQFLQPIPSRSATSDARKCLTAALKIEPFVSFIYRDLVKSGPTHAGNHRRKSKNQHSYFATRPSRYRQPCENHAAENLRFKMQKYPLPGHSVEQVFDSYCQYLAHTFGNPSQQLKSFIDRYNEDPEPVRGEAVVFTWLSNIGMNPTVNELPGTGGMDFLCQPASRKDFFVEVTCIGNEAMAKETRLPLELQNGVGGAYGLPTEMLRQRVGTKMEQLSRGNLPRVLAITSEHPIVNAVFDANGAVCLFLSQPKILVPFDGSPEREITDLSNSVFMKADKNDPTKILSARRSASAVILVPIHAADVRPIGLLHPDAALPLNLGDWYQTPFIRIREWPIENGSIGIEWTIPYGEPFPVHKRLRFARDAKAGD